MSDTNAAVAAMKDVSKIKFDLNKALRTLLEHSFDADSRTCVITMIKLLDNVLQKPGNDKVRRIRVSNPNFWQKVGRRKGAMDYLVACGFVRTTDLVDSEQNSSSAVPGTMPRMELDRDVRMKDISKLDPHSDVGFLQLLPDQEDTQVLLQARQQLATCAVHELKIPSQDLPAYKPPPALDSAVAAAKRSAASNLSSSNSSSPSFNIYRGSRFDGQAAATGVRIGPDDGTAYKSPTEQSLERLQQRQKQLERKIQPRQIADREWFVYRPGTNQSSVSSVSVDSSDASFTETSSPSSDVKLLAARAKQQMEQRNKAENAGFTTKAMRDLAKLKNQKVYSHTTIQIQFPDGCWVRGKFLPTETVADVERILRTRCLRPELFQTSSDAASAIGIELYITPPRQVLKPPSSTLSSHQLVPAAKVFVSFSKPVASVQLASPGHYLHPDLIAQADRAAGGGGGASFPTSMAIEEQQLTGETENKSNDAGSSSEDKKKKKTKRNKEEDLLKRMMGGGLGFGKRK